MQPRLFLMAPEGGAITSLAYESGEMVSNGTVEDRQFINLRLTQGIKPGETVTIAFTVRAAEKAKSTLDVVTTPIINEKGIYTGTNGKVTDTCGADVPDAVEDQWAGTGSDGTDGGKSSGKTSSKLPTRTRTPPTPPMEVCVDKLSSINGWPELSGGSEEIHVATDGRAGTAVRVRAGTLRRLTVAGELADSLRVESFDPSSTNRKR